VGNVTGKQIQGCCLDGRQLQHYRWTYCAHMCHSCSQQRVHIAVCCDPADQQQCCTAPRCCCHQPCADRVVAAVLCLQTSTTHLAPCTCMAQSTKQCLSTWSTAGQTSQCTCAWSPTRQDQMAVCSCSRRRQRQTQACIRFQVGTSTSCCMRMLSAVRMARAAALCPGADAGMNGNSTSQQVLVVRCPA
jgi:hypothetical protein